MKHLDLINEFRELLGQLRKEVESASAMQLYDTHKIAEQVICGVMRELYSLSHLRNLNSEQSNFPGIDLADDVARIAVQVTATTDLAKIKSTLETFLGHELHKNYDRVIVYVLTKKQSSYSQSAIDTITDGHFSFSATADVIDYQDLSARAAQVEPKELQKALNVLKDYLHGAPRGGIDEVFDPPAESSETLIANLLELYFPSIIYVGQVSNKIMEEHKKKRGRNLRDSIGKFCRETMMPIPSTYVAHNGNLISFFDLTQEGHPYRHVIEDGTVEELSAQDYFNIDEDHEKVFKSLLRFSLQHRLYSESVSWYNDDKLFVFLPRDSDGDVRQEAWHGERQATRTVFERKYNRKDPSKVFTQKHLAFSVDFHRFVDKWMMSITPTWFFSYGDEFRKSGYGYKSLSWLKRNENNRAVLNHFRFLTAWLKSIDTTNLFSSTDRTDSFLSFGDCLTLKGAPLLDEKLWEPLRNDLAQDNHPTMQSLFSR